MAQLIKTCAILYLITKTFIGLLNKECFNSQDSVVDLG